MLSSDDLTNDEVGTDFKALKHIVHGLIKSKKKIAFPFELFVVTLNKCSTKSRKNIKASDVASGITSNLMHSRASMRNREFITTFTPSDLFQIQCFSNH